MNKKLSKIPKDHLIVAVALFLLLVTVLLGSFTPVPLWGLGLIDIWVLCVVAVRSFRHSEQEENATAQRQAVPVYFGDVIRNGIQNQNIPYLIYEDSKDGMIVWNNTACSVLAEDDITLFPRNCTVKKLLGCEISDFLEGQAKILTVRNKTFQVFPSHFRNKGKNFCMLSFTEITDREKLQKMLSERETLVAYIFMDNLDYIPQREQDRLRTVTVQIENVLREWAKSVHGVWQEYERDRSIFFFEAKYLNTFIRQQFDILEKIRTMQENNGRNTVITVSIGVGAVDGSLDDKEHAAAAALEMAINRGGNQACVKNDKSIDSYGGRTHSTADNTTVQARSMANDLIPCMKGASNVVVMGHKHADFDAFGSCVGIARLALSVGAKVNIVTDMQDRNLAKCREMLATLPEYQDVLTDTRDAMELVQARTLLVIVDVNNAKIFENPALAENIEDIFIIDHHSQTQEIPKNIHKPYIEPKAGACCELIAEMMEIVLQEKMLTATEANLMLAGILLDTKQFTKNTGARTFRSALYLRENGASPTKTQDFFRNNFVDFTRERKFKLIDKVYRGVIAMASCDNGEVGDNITAAKVADELLTIEGIQASFAIVNIDGQIYISGRSAEEINVARILERLGGGGRFEAAAAQLKNVGAAEACALLKKAIDEYFNPTY